MEKNRLVCRLCKFSAKYRPDRKKINPGRLWCTVYRRETPCNSTCPKGRAL